MIPVMGRLLLLFIIVPVVELTLLLQIGDRIGLLATIGLVVGTGALGASLARWQGLGVLRKAQAEMAAGRLPAGQLVEGVLILVAGAVLMTPGVLTDAFGFFCLIPAGRRLLKAYLVHRLERSVRNGNVRMSVDFGAGFHPETRAEPRDVTPRPETPTRSLDGP